jgi:hypothetical protein
MPKSIGQATDSLARRCLELRDQAIECDLPLLAHLLDMAALEAANNEVRGKAKPKPAK